MCSRPSVPGIISTKAPNSTIFRTLPSIDAADLGFSGDRLNRVNRLFHRGGVGGGNQNRAVVLNIDLATGLFDQSADNLAAGADDVANLVGFDMQGNDSRGVGRNFLARLLQRFLHHAEDEHWASRA